jgi:hypothetical protein
MKSDTRSPKLTEKMNEIQQKVISMPQGGDLESLIESGLGEINKILFEELITLRDQVSRPNRTAFSPCDMSGLPKRGDSMVGDAKAKGGLDA